MIHNLKKFGKILVIMSCVGISTTSKAQTPNVFVADAQRVSQLKKESASDPTIQKAVKALAKRADDLLDKTIYSVVDKKMAPPCRNMHEYMSMARYYWPDPSKPDGLPYIQKDGLVNPENAKVTDHKGTDDLISYVPTLTWSYYFTNDKKQADKAISLLKFYFVDTATLMLPNMNHAQLIRGRDTGRGIGIIDIHLMPQLIDAISILETAKLLKPQDEQTINKWYKDFLYWLQNSKNGKNESQEKNNHKTWYNNLVLSIAFLCKDETTINSVLANTKSMLAAHIEPNGSQPLELKRTNALSYSTFNIKAWFMMASMAEKRNIDLWHYEAPNDASLKKALDFILPYALKEKPFPYQQIGAYPEEKDLYNILLIAAKKYNDNNYKIAAQKLTNPDNSPLSKLLYEY